VKDKMNEGRGEREEGGVRSKHRKEGVNERRTEGGEKGRDGWRNLNKGRKDWTKEGEKKLNERRKIGSHEKERM
jgi:hypothetical protein